MNLSRRLCLLMLALSATTAARAQTGSITGTVIDAATGRPIEGASIRIAGTPLGTTSSVNGGFTIIGISPGAYTVSAQRLGFAIAELAGVHIEIGRTRTLAFALRPAPSDSVDRAALPPPTLDANFGGTSISLTGSQVVAQPTVTLSGALAALGGYLNLPRSTAVLSLADLRRGVTGSATVRAARPSATLYLLDGFPVNNVSFGSPPLLLEPFGAANVVFAPAHVDAEHGGALSGMVSQAIRDGSARTAGAFEFQTAGVAAKLGSTADDASGSYVARGYLAGPMPFARDAFRYSLSGHLIGERAQVVRTRATPWRGVGDDGNGQLTAKLSYTVSPSLRLSLAALGQRRRVMGMDPDYLEGDSVAPPVVRGDTRFIIGRIEKRVARAHISLSAAETKVERETCSIWQGVCVEERIARIPQGSEIPGFGLPPRQTPYAASGQFYASEASTTHAARADITVAAGDHHQLGAGVYFARHHFDYRDVTAYRWLQGSVLTSIDAYRARPVEFATYVQDALQFDLVTVHLGFRFDYGNTGGMAFVNPQNPTNGTTAREVCEGTAPGLSESPYTYGEHRGLVACINSPIGAGGRPFLLDSATNVARRDDMRHVRPRAAFAPRIGLSFPLTEQSGLYLNVGRFNKHPGYHDAFRNTGLGSRAGLSGKGDGMCDGARPRPGTTECLPNLQLPPTLTEFAGNPDLSFEMANAFEAGFTSLAGASHALDASVFSSVQSFLPSLYPVATPADIGLTYGPVTQGTQRTVRNRGSSESLGIAVTVRRRRAGPVSYTVNYVWQRSTDIGVPPEFVAEALVAGEILNNDAEQMSARNRTHSLSAQLSWQWRASMESRMGPFAKALLRHSRTVVTVSSGSGSYATQNRPAVCANNLPCAPISAGLLGTGTLVNLLYVRTLTTTGPQWSFVVRVRNLLDESDGSAALSTLLQRSRAASGVRGAAMREELSLRRILTGVSVTF